jgi:ComF family protein
MAAGPWANLNSGCSWCRDRRLGFDAAVSLGPYQGPIRELCLNLKNEKQAWRARWAADLLVEARAETLRGYKADLVVAVPLHWWRRLKRGYNQAEALASHLARRLGLPKVHALRRVEHTPKLADRSRGERAELLRTAFRARNGMLLNGRTVLLVDDILTTGATCGAAARALKTAGATKVVAVVLGRSEGRK